MSSGSPGDFNIRGLRGLRGGSGGLRGVSRRMWSSDEEDTSPSSSSKLNTTNVTTPKKMAPAGSTIKAELSRNSSAPSYVSTLPQQNAATRIRTPERISEGVRATSGENETVMLRKQLDNAASEFKAQAREWQELLSIAKGEVNSLCRQCKSEREIISQKVVENTRDLDRMFESAQKRTDGTPAFTSRRPKNLAEDCASVSGGVSGSQVCDVVSSLVTSLVGRLEESLSIKVGYIGGLFHSWRCEVVLNRAGGRFEKSRQIFEAQREKIMLQWFMGDTKGLVETALRSWKKFAEQARRTRSQHGQINMVCAKWLLGNANGLLMTTIRAWSDQADFARQQRLANDWQRMLDDKDATMKQKFAEWEKRNAKAKQDMFLVFAKWEKGSIKGLLKGTWEGWSTNVANAKAAAKRQAVFKQMISQWFEGQAKGLLRSSLQAWCAYIHHNSAMLAERRKLEDLLNGELAKREQEAAERERQKRERAKSSVELAAKKWIMGSIKGLMSEVYTCWSKYTTNSVRIRSSKADAQVALAKFLEGDRRGVLHTTFLHWKAMMQEVLAARAQERESEAAKRQFSDFLAEQQCEWQQSLQEQRKEAARKASQMLVSKWLLGQTKGLLVSVVKSWQEYTKKSNDKQRQHESAKMVVLRFLEGEQRALYQMCFGHWHKFALMEALHHHTELTDRLEGQLQVHIEKAKTKLLKYFAKLGDGTIMMEMCFGQWHQLVLGADAQRQLEMQLEEQDRLNKLKDAENKEKKLSALEYLGLKSNKTVLMKHYYGWVQYNEQARLAREGKMKKNQALESLGRFLEGSQVAKTRMELLTVSFREWVHDMHYSAKVEIDSFRVVTERLELERSQLVEQLNLVYHQLDSMTETLQTELKTKEELANELREANEHLRKAQFSASSASAGYIDVETLMRNSRDGAMSRGTSPGSSYHERNTGRCDPEGTSIPGRRTPRLQKTTSTPVLHSRRMSSKEDKSDKGSPSSCDWDHAIVRLRDQGRFRQGEGPRF